MIFDVRHAVPRVPRPMVAALPHAVREEVAFDHIPTPEPVVEIESGAGPVKVDVAGEIRGRRGRLEPHRRLLLPYPDLVDEVVGDAGAAGLVAAAAVGSDGVRNLLGAVGVEAVPGGAPGRHGAVANPAHFVVVDLRAAVVVGEEDPVTVDARHEARVDLGALGALEEDRARPLQRPVAARRHAVDVGDVGAEVPERG